MTDPRIYAAGLIAAALFMVGVAAYLMLRDNSMKDMEDRVLTATRQNIERDTPDRKSVV